MQIPDDLMELDLTMPVIKQIIEVREKKKKAQAVLAPSQSRIALAQARVKWAEEAETALKNGEPVKPYPSNRKENGEAEAEPKPEKEEPKPKQRARATR